MRIVILSPSIFPQPGGLQRYTYSLADSLATDGHQITVLTLLSPPHAVPIESGFTHISLASELIPADTAIRKIRQKIALYRTLVKLIKRAHADRVICTWWEPLGYISALVCRHLHIPFTVITHGQEILVFPKARATKWLKKRLLRYTLSSAQQIVSVSEFTAKKVQIYVNNSDKIRVLPNALTRSYVEEAASATKKVEFDGFVILQVGRVVARKGHHLMLQILLELQQKMNQPVYYVVVGSGPELQALQRHSVTLACSPPPIFLGYIPDSELHGYYLAANVLVMPVSHDENNVEGFGIVFLEAYAHSCPVIGSRTGGIPDAIIDSETGLLVPPDDLDSLRDAILYMLNHPAKAQQMAQTGRQLLNTQWNWNNVARQLLQ